MNRKAVVYDLATVSLDPRWIGRVSEGDEMSKYKKVRSRRNQPLLDTDHLPRKTKWTLAILAVAIVAFAVALGLGAS